MVFPFNFGRLQKVTLSLSFLPDSWVDSFLATNQRIQHLSLSVQPTMITDRMVPKIEHALSELKFLEIDFASNLQTATILQLLQHKHLKDLLLSHLNSDVYSALKENSQQIDALGWNVVVFSKFKGAKFERNKGKDHRI